MALVHRVSDAAQRARGGSLARGGHRLVTIGPIFATNKPAVTDCTPTRCRTLARQPASFVYVRTRPSFTSPLAGDQILHPGGHGTTADSDWGDKATTGERFVIAGQRGGWTAIWFSGRKAWFHSPSGARQTGLYTGGEVMTPAPGRASIPVYGAAYPQRSAYPSRMPVKKVVKLAYTIRASQAYPTIGRVPADYYYAATINSSRPHDHTVITGRQAYYQISFNHRKFFVRAGDIITRALP